MSPYSVNPQGLLVIETRRIALQAKCKEEFESDREVIHGCVGYASLKCALSRAKASKQEQGCVRMSAILPNRAPKLPAPEVTVPAAQADIAFVDQAAADAAHATTGWDPYEVWHSRIFVPSRHSTKK